uniref:NADH dehydrogenase subunit 6 n=1 Tax=Pseudocrangonyx daejeonensis TaxID=2038767 RepID=A0A346SAG4_9CRUS|nr:NADH dehydrogenase subunit 6 [Pseudocrangonyx daejeonensis]AXT17552.1 NADH dehydrogenase subunit 6 [Pseudocrangonyx daejeonensis]
MLTFMSFMLTMITIIFVYLQHSLFMALSLVAQASLLAVTLFIAAPTPWYSYILLMLFVSGMMIIFIYTASMASNEITPPYPSYILGLSLTSTLMLWTPVLFYMSTSTFQIDTSFNTYMLTYKPYTPSWIYFTLFLILYLLVVLILSVKLTSLSNKPLRA